MKNRAFYAPGTVHYMRLKTDAQFIADDLTAKYTGIAEKTARFAVKAQCTDPARWARFVNQFRLRTDGQDNAWRGEYWGKAMRGAAFLYAFTRDEALYAVLCDTVEDLLSAADETGAIASYPPEAEFGGWDIWCRKYVLLGLQYFIEICRDEALISRCVAAMEAQVKLFMETFGPEKRRLTEATPYWRGLAAASVLEPVVRLYDITGKREYLDFAAHIVSLGGTSVADIYKIAFEGRTPPYQFPMTKAYEMMSCFEGLLEYYRATGDEACKTAVLNFANLAAENEITVIGSAGCTHELFDHARRRQTDPRCTDVMQETCVTVTWMKLCVQLLCLTGESAWADRFEQAYYNAYLGAVNTEHKTDVWLRSRWPDAIPEALPFISYAPLLPDVRGKRVGGLCLMADGHYYGCCAAIGGAGAGLPHKAAVTYTRTGLAINLFLPGTVTAALPCGTAVTLKTETEYPVGNTVKIAVQPEAPARFPLQVRIPVWSAKTALTVNGEAFPAVAGTYTEITRDWAPGDQIELKLDLRIRVLRPEKWETDVIVADYVWRHNYMVPRVIAAPENAQGYFALRRGPLVLARDQRSGGNPRSAVSVRTDAAGFALSAPGDAPFPHLLALRFTDAAGESFTAVDYASAGKTMDEASLCGCWFTLKE